MARLRGPGGCPWDREQTIESLRGFVLEETYEVLDAIDVPVLAIAVEVGAVVADAVVAHMIPAYVLLAAPLVRPRRTPLLLWYTHWKASPTLRAAERLATAIVSVDRRSFPLESPKVRPIGHGIDVSEFACADRAGRTGLQALVLGRYSPAKGIETILRAVQQVEGAGVRLHGVALNELERRHRSELERLGVPLGDAVPRTMRRSHSPTRPPHVFVQGEAR